MQKKSASIQQKSTKNKGEHPSRITILTKILVVESTFAEAEIWYVDDSHKYKINQGVMVGGQP